MLVHPSGGNRTINYTTGKYSFLNYSSNKLCFTVIYTEYNCMNTETYTRCAKFKVLRKRELCVNYGDRTQYSDPFYGLDEILLKIKLILIGVISDVCWNCPSNLTHNTNTTLKWMVIIRLWKLFCLPSLEIHLLTMNGATTSPIFPLDT